MLKATTPLVSVYKLLLIGLFIFAGAYGCKQKHHKENPKISLSVKIKSQIARGERLINLNNDSLKIITQELFDLYKASGNDTALVYGDYFESVYYWHIADEQKAMRWAIRALAHAQKANIAEPRAKIYSLIASIDNQITDYTLAHKTIQQGLDVAIRAKDTASVIALLGLKGMFTRGETIVSKDTALLNESLQINFIALKMAQSRPIYEPLQVRLLNNIGQCYLDKKQFPKAIFFLKNAIAIALKYNRQQAIIHAYCRVGEAYYYSGNHKAGILNMLEALKKAHEQHDSYWLLEANSAIYRCYTFSGNYRQALQYNTAYRYISDSLKALDNVRHIGELQLKYEAAQKDKEINRLNAADRIDALQRNAAALVMLLLSVIAVLIYLKTQKEKKLLLAEKALLDDELRSAALELSHFTESLKHKNELIEEFKAQLERLHLQNVNKEDIERLEKLLNAHIMTEENWDGFKRLFDKVHVGFFAGLKRKVPDGNFTGADIRILVLTKLQLGNAEMANLLGITLEGIKKSKQRLRKKLGLEPGENLKAFIDSI